MGPEDYNLTEVILPCWSTHLTCEVVGEHMASCQLAFRQSLCRGSQPRDCPSHSVLPGITLDTHKIVLKI